MNVPRIPLREPVDSTVRRTRTLLLQLRAEFHAAPRVQQETIASMVADLHLDLTRAVVSR